MGGDEHLRAIALAQASEKRGDVDAAASAYFRAGEVDEAARVLVAAGRFVDAARVLVQSLGVPPKKVGTLGPDGRRRAQRAAVCFARGGYVKMSVELFLALGDTVRAAEVLERSGDRLAAARVLQAAKSGAPASAFGSPTSTREHSLAEAAQRLEAAGHFEEAAQAFMQLKRLTDAARCLRSLGKLLEAGKLYQEAGQMAEAARCFLSVGDTGLFLETVARVPRNHPSYRAACVEAARVASSLGVLDFQLDQFFGHFTSTGPVNDAEAEAFYRLGRLYEAHDYADSARDLYTRLSSARPRFRDVEERLATLASGQGGSAMVDAKIRREDVAFHTTSGDRARGAKQADSVFPALPDFPALPNLSEPPRPAGGAATVPMNPSAFAQAPAAPSFDGSPGSLIAGRYRVEAKLGEGGMAIVYRALDLELDDSVAIKLFLQPSDDPELLQRFRQELAVCRQIAHPNVVRLFDIGTHDSRKFISMELLAGSDLAAVLEGGRMELQRAVNFLVQACAGLQAAHERGVVHRDVKPENFFVTEGDVLKVMDFGIAKRTESPGLTRVGFLAGTPQYMAPEQIQDFGTVTHLADIYALGCVAYELFTGQVPFTHEELVPLLMMQVNERPRPLREHVPDFPEELDALVLRLLEKEPAKRLQSCRELSRELRRMMR